MHAIFLDIETTGLDPKRHHSIDIAFKIIDISKDIPIKEYQSVIRQPPEAWDQRDLTSMKINGYTWEEILTGKGSSEVRSEIIKAFSEVPIQRGAAVFICQNPGFDRAFFSQIVDVYTQESLNWPYHWLDLASMYWAFLSKSYQEKQISFPEVLNLSKNEIAKVFQIPAEKSPHRAINGVNHLIECYQAVIGHRFAF